MSQPLKVYFLDESYKSFAVDPLTTTMEQLWGQMCDKLELQPSSCPCFYLWCKNDKLELLNFSDATVQECQTSWPQMISKYCRSAQDATHSLRQKIKNLIKRQPEPAMALGGAAALAGSAVNLGVSGAQGMKFYFRTTAVLARDLIEQSLADPPARRLHFIQSVYDVTQANYPVTAKDAVSLAAIHLQIVVGNFRGAPDHGHGYLCGKDMAIKQYYPRNYVKSLKQVTSVRNAARLTGGGAGGPLLQRPANEVESRIFEAWRALADRQKDELYMEYINIVKQYAAFGCTFFKVRAVSDDVGSMVYTQEFEGKLSLGVSQDGLFLMNEDTRNIVHYDFTDLKSWGCDADYFWIKLADRPKKEEQLVFATGLGTVIRDLLGEWDTERDASITRMETMRNMNHLVKK